MNLLIAAGSLLAKLVARNIDDLKALILDFIVEILQRIVLGRKAAAGSRVDDQQ